MRNAIQFDLCTFTPAADAGAGKLIDIYFGKVIHNAITPQLVKRRTYQLERLLGNDGVGIQSEYLVGAVADQFNLTINQASKITVDVNYVGMDVEQRDGTTGIKSGTRVGLPGEPPFNTSHEVYRSMLYVLNATTANPVALYAYVQDVKLNINNGAVPNKAIGVQGGFDLSEGDFAVNGTATAYFATVAAVAAIQDNADVGMFIALAAHNAGMIWDIPLLTLGDGAEKVEKDKPILISLTQDAAKCAAGFTLLGNFFEYLPNAAMPL